MTKKNILINAACVVVGATIGSAATWFVVKKKYEKIAQEEIDSVMEARARLKNIDEVHEYHIDAGNGTVAGTVEEESMKIVEECRNIMNGYSTYSSDVMEGGDEDMEPYDKPYVISPEDYDDIQDYTKVMLTYYADHVLAEDNDDIVEDVENTVGRASLTTFGQYEDDTVFVRNDAKRTDYEITLDTRTYAEVVNPYPGYDA